MKGLLGRIIPRLQVLLDHRLTHGFVGSLRVGLGLRELDEGLVVIGAVEV